MDYNSADTTELETMLARLQHDLEDVEETIDFHFTYTSAHIGGHEVRKDQERLEQLKEHIANIKEVLSTRTQSCSARLCLDNWTARILITEWR